MRQKMVSITVFALILFLAFPIEGGQRMGISPGTYSISAGSSKRVPTYCMDFSKAAPSSSSVYRHVLSGGSASVRIGHGASARVMSLQQAIDTGKVSIKGCNLTMDRLLELCNEPTFLARMSPEEKVLFQQIKDVFNERSPGKRFNLVMDLLSNPGLLKDLSPVERRMIAQFRNEYEKLPPDQKAQVASLFDTMFNQMMGSIVQEVGGDYTQMEFQSLIDEAMVLIFGGESKNEPTYIGDERPIIDSPLPTKLPLTDDGKPDQQRIWIEEMFTRFNKNTSGSKFIFLEESGTSQKAAFRAYMDLRGTEKEIWEGESMHAFAAELSNLLERDRRIEDVYVSLIGFEPERIRPTQETLERALKPLTNGVGIRILDQESLPLLILDLLFDRSANVNLETGPIEKVQGGTKDGWFKSAIRFVKGEKQTSGTIFSKSKDILQGFIDKVKNLFKYNMRQDSPVDIFNKTKKEFLEKHHLKEEELIMEINSVEITKVEMTMLHARAA